MPSSRYNEQEVRYITSFPFVLNAADELSSEETTVIVALGSVLELDQPVVGHIVSDPTYSVGL